MSFTDFSKYSGEQLIVNADRVLVNAKKDSVFILAKESIGFSTAGSFHVNVGTKNNTSKDNKYIINSPRIELGLGTTQQSLQPIAKGDETAQIFNDLLTALSSFSTGMQAAIGVGVGTVDMPAVKMSSNKLLQDVTRIQKNVQKIKSQTTFSI